MKKALNFLEFKDSLYQYSFDSKRTKGRRYKEDEELSLYGESYNPFQLDIDKIRLDKFFRRLSDKTQVFPVNSHKNIRNRLIHTNEVVCISSFAANILGLNQKLVEAIAYGHDIGHTAYGHLGERFISNKTKNNFSHAVMGVVVCQNISRGGRGLNLSYETLKGILNHSSRGNKGDVNNQLINNSLNNEESLVRICDKIAYIFSDISDCFKLGFLNKNNKPPKELLAIFGETQRERVARTLYYLIKESAINGKISFSESEESQLFMKLRMWMYENIYHKIDKLCYRESKTKELEQNLNFFSKNLLFKDYNPFLISAILTDSESKNIANNNIEACYGCIEIIKKIKNKGLNINIFEPDLKERDFIYYRGVD